ncbi:LON peptidase substrate-binding domain-containing protein, partial [Klebsiella pneumoniae]|uniref:LON peptidase substrate-binding domain-containing protein n=1 Tax=Klebsiella pneumoniae TaxID=573 RepID=UPI003853FBCB
LINFIPIFPLSIVVFPGETLNLHIFEPRYRQLIQECFAEQKPFGIPTVLQKGIADLGTLVEITEIVTVHEDGKMDIRTRGLKIFSILELIRSIPD